jgi:hypothetical protein
VRSAAVAGPVVALGVAEPAQAARCAPLAEVPSLLAHDMVGKHAGRMHGVPLSYDWATRPRVGVGNHPARRGFQAISAWGQIYEDAAGSPARNVRVACRDISLWILSRRTGKWRRANGSRRVNGANYLEDFTGNQSKPADLRNEPDGAVSATLGGGYNFHLYSIRTRSRIDPADVAGVVSIFSARVIMDDPHGPDERHLARYLASAGGDYWLDEHVGSAPGTVADVGIGKARYLTSDWLTLSMSTLSIRRLRQNPPRLCLRRR